MARVFSATLIAVCIWLSAFRLASCEGEDQNPDIVDAFKVYESFPYVLALYDIDNDGDLDCLNAVRTDLEKEPRSATYTLSLKDKDLQNIRIYTYYLTPGPTPDTTVVIIDNDYEHPLTNRIAYTDYEKCSVMEFPINQREVCVMWVRDSVKDEVPETCVAQYQKNCREATPVYDKDSCEGLIY
uniref:Putative lipocalin-5 1 n=1 Tax=Amblyomma triste TaxID=251400 RepID=A0A023GAC0_AMBTT